MSCKCTVDTFMLATQTELTFLSSPVDKRSISSSWFLPACQFFTSSTHHPCLVHIAPCQSSACLRWRNCMELFWVCLPPLLFFIYSFLGIMTNRKSPVTSWEPCGSSQLPSFLLDMGTWYHTHTVGKACACWQGSWYVPFLLN